MQRHIENLRIENNEKDLEIIDINMISRENRNKLLKIGYEFKAQ